jgi:transcriptional regulator with XRE-family HTH domain
MDAMKLKTFLQNKSRQEFADKVGTTRNYINLLCTGHRRPGPELARRIVMATEGMVTLEEALGLEPIPEFLQEPEF